MSIGLEVDATRRGTVQFRTGEGRNFSLSRSILPDWIQPDCPVHVTARLTRTDDAERPENGGRRRAGSDGDNNRKKSKDHVFLMVLNRGWNPSSEGSHVRCQTYYGSVVDLPAELLTDDPDPHDVITLSFADTGKQP